MDYIWDALEPATIRAEFGRPIDGQDDGIAALVEVVDGGPVIGVRHRRGVARVGVRVRAPEAVVVVEVSEVVPIIAESPLVVLWREMHHDGDGVVHGAAVGNAFEQPTLPMTGVLGLCVSEN